jgi:type IV pilus assembly protein PilX
VLITSLLILIILTVLAVGMYHSFSVQENMAANTKEKGRAFQIAQSTLGYAEWQLTNNLSVLAQSGSCNGTLTTLTAITVCTNNVSVVQSPSSSAVMIIGNGMKYTTMVPALPISSTGGSGTYYDYPQFYIRYLGLSPSGLDQIYQITALGYGGNANATAVVQSVYQLTTNVKNLGGL